MSAIPRLYPTATLASVVIIDQELIKECTRTEILKQKLISGTLTLADQEEAKRVKTSIEALLSLKHRLGW